MVLQHICYTTTCVIFDLHKKIDVSFLLTVK